MEHPVMALMQDPLGALRAQAAARAAAPLGASDFISLVGGPLARAAADAVVMPSPAPLPPVLLEPHNDLLAGAPGDTQLRVGDSAFALGPFVTAAPPPAQRVYAPLQGDAVHAALQFTPRPDGDLREAEKGQLPSAPPPLLFADIHVLKKVKKEKTEEDRRRKEEKKRKREAAAAAEQTGGTGGGSTGDLLSSGGIRVASPPPVKTETELPAAAAPPHAAKQRPAVKVEADAPRAKRAKPTPVAAEPHQAAKQQRPPPRAVERPAAPPVAQTAMAPVPREVAAAPLHARSDVVPPMAEAPKPEVMPAQPAAPVAPAAPPRPAAPVSAVPAPPPALVAPKAMNAAAAVRGAGTGFKLEAKCPKIDGSLVNKRIIMKGVGDRGDSYHWGVVKQVFKRPTPEGYNVEVAWGGGTKELRDAILLAEAYVGIDTGKQESEMHGWAVLRKT